MVVVGLGVLVNANGAVISVVVEVENVSVVVEVENGSVALETVTAIVNDRVHYLCQGQVHPVLTGRRRPSPCAT